MNRITKDEIDIIIRAYFSIAYSGLLPIGAYGDWKKAWDSKVVDIIKKYPEYADFYLTNTKRFAWTPTGSRGGKIWTGEEE